MKIKWNGDGADLNTKTYGLTFAAGETVEVADDHPGAKKLAANPSFSLVTADEGPFKVFKNGQKWFVSGPEGTPDAGPFNKADATAYADAENAKVVG